jgi:hypothetical protein
MEIKNKNKTKQKNKRIKEIRKNHFYFVLIFCITFCYFRFFFLKIKN